LTGKPEGLREKCVSVPPYPPQIAHGMLGIKTRPVHGEATNKPSELWHGLQDYIYCSLCIYV